MKTIGLSLALTCALACSSPPQGNPNTNPSDGGTTADSGSDGNTSTADSGKDGASSPQALTCGSYGFCSDYVVMIYTATQSTPTGGQIADGLYRLAYVITNGDDGGNTQNDGLFLVQGNSLLSLETFSFFSAQLGTLATSSTELTFTATAACDAPDAVGSGGGFNSPPTVPYSVDESGAVHLFEPLSGSSGNFTHEEVYIPVTDPCAAVSSVPSSPGDSYMCQVSNCACSSNADGPADHSICSVFMQ